MNREDESMAKKICSVDGCESVVHARGMCWKHEREILGIDPSTGKSLAVAAALPGVKPAKPRCSVAGCTKQIQQAGMCKRHRTLALLDAGVDPVDKIIEHVVKAAKIQVEEVIEAPTAGIVPEMNALFQAKLNEWLEDLAGATTERSRARMFVAMTDAVEMLGY
jgi:hypothetical protein